ncbi:unnamed protein product [Zymoseptoria tritici ST99CH_3D7]|uniref:Uncharacterized protein n=1 Tax=Zymoseptoria tritici (strain ST99CH_3D7) TaxID=1276538 RepID=A0A1X7S5B5_ZYMT9|nr:unnamed protein product [Zymoseptoria tritici ST99CH_3D7]
MTLLDTLQVIAIPAFIAAGLYALIAFAIIPLIRNHRERYSQYLPMASISSSTSSIRDRITNTLTMWIVPRRHLVHDAEGWRRGSSSGDEAVFEDADGDQMVGFDVNRSERRVRDGNVERNI